MDLDLHVPVRVQAGFQMLMAACSYMHSNWRQLLRSLSSVVPAQSSSWCHRQYHVSMFDARPKFCVVELDNL